MGLKLTSSAWVSANEENRVQRNDARDAFFVQTRAKRVSSIRDIHIPLADRLNKIEAQYGKAMENRIEDPSLAELAALSKAALILSGLAVPSVPLGPERPTFGLQALSPEILQRFFKTDQETALWRSLFYGR